MSDEHDPRSAADTAAAAAPISALARAELARRGVRRVGSIPDFERDPELHCLRLAARGDFDSFTPATVAASSSWSINRLRRALRM
jgi:hypothetical protein